ncbi:MAG: PIN domain-containing protein [Bacteroidota bacterium]
MNDKKFFIDSNVFLYLLDKKEEKKHTARALLANTPVISTQVINENINVAIKDFKLAPAKAFEHAENIISMCDLKFISLTTIRIGYDILFKYKYSFYDCLIIASALENNCITLYSEDMQHNQLIENNLTIVNPFL